MHRVELMSTTALAVCTFLMLTSSCTAQRGHMKALGGQRDPEGTVEEIDGFPSPEDFYDKYILPSKPVLMRGAAKDLKAYSLWTDQHMSSRFGKEWVEVEEGKKENRDLGMWTESFGDFLRKYQGKDSKDRYRGNFYSVSAMPNPQRAEYEIPRLVNCPKVTAERMHQINHWFSGGGTSSVLHRDANENLNCLMDGSKDLVFINKTYSERELYWDFSQNHHHSHVDCDRVDLNRFPNFAQIKWWHAHMEKGDCLFIPVGWFHHVKSYGTRNYAVNLWFDIPHRSLVAGCNPEAAAGPLTADRIRFVREELPEPPDGSGDYGDDDEL